MADLSTLTAIRGRLKGSITRAHTYALELSADATYEQVASRIEQLKEVWKSFCDAVEHTYSYQGAEGYVSPDTDFATYESKYLEALDSFTRALAQRTPMSPQNTSNDALQTLSVQQTQFLQQMSAVSNSHANDLPKINIPPFSGQYNDWPSFRDLFESSVAHRTNLTNTQCFHYLKSVLKGDAANIIKHVQVTEEAYTTAWRRLTERYNKPRLIVNAFITTFMALPSTATEVGSTLRTIADGANEVIRGLDAMKIESRDCWLIHILLDKVDTETRRKWAKANNNDASTPSLEEFLTFLDARCEQLELLQGMRKTNSQRKSPTTVTRTMLTLKASGCANCGIEGHDISKCSQFLAMTTYDHRQVVASKGLCFNCLRAGHRVPKSSSKFSCRECRQKHHTLIHASATQSSSSAASSATSDGTPGPIAVTVPHLSQQPQWRHHNSSAHTPILPTALVTIYNAQRHPVTCRILLDSASELSLISERCAKVLGLPRSNSRLLVSGISAISAEHTRGSCSVEIRSRTEDFRINAQVHILSKITSMLPTSLITHDSAHHLNRLNLADPSFHTPGEIDILLGVQHIWGILTCNKVFNAEGEPIAISSHFGWIVTSGQSTTRRQHTPSLLSVVNIDESLRAFWELEEVQHTTVNADEDFAEQHFLDTHTRCKDGRFKVQLPFKSATQTFEDTFQGALSRFLAVERRLTRDDSLRSQYIAFMREYIQLGHMRPLCQEEIPVTDGQQFYMPHHSVVGKKLRVVFDGSFKDAAGVSLNDCLHVGPRIQRNLVGVCLRFRMHRFVFSADIVKMFRQMWVAEEHRNFQRIVWRESPSQPVQHFQLCTVTYGTSCAPFLAIRVLEQIAEVYKHTHPVASQILRQDFYVDDVLTGAASLEALTKKRDELVAVLACAGLHLDKWVSNCDFPSSNPDAELHHAFAKVDNAAATKVLGLYWKPQQDVLAFHVQLEETQRASKRQVLSDVARIFDPIGLLAPIVVQFKILFQELWLKNLNWDDPLPPDLERKWTRYRSDMHAQQLSLPRFVYNNTNHIELHGFSDASVKAYAAVVYCRTLDDNGHVHISLVAAKTRVAPLKQVSLPRLELCGALLLARLIASTQKSLAEYSTTAYAWCDSTIVLAWLSQPPFKLKTFVANRTTEILDTLPRDVWRHVKSADNPADCASRGMMSQDLLHHTLWWNGPNWLSYVTEFDSLPRSNEHFSPLTDPAAAVEVRTTPVNTLLTQPLEPGPIAVLLSRVSTWRKALRVVAYVIRFVSRCNPNRKMRYTGGLKFDELTSARLLCLRHAQVSFEEDRGSLQRNVQLSKGSKLVKLAPYLDTDHLIRVGGRIRHSLLAAHTQHPVILPRNHRVTQLIIQDEHERNLYPSVTNLLVILRQRYWILGARNLVKTFTFQCVKCFRYRRHATQQLMSDLPSVRVRKAFPFENSGCDYAGPITLYLHRGRNPRTSKGNICLFVCMTTSAIHLELVTELSTECFLSALRRFMSRRGRCSKIFSDNGRNIVGASGAIREMQQLLQSQTHNELVASSLAEDGIRWHYIPPHAPHWGGMWKSAVRSVKLHLRRVLGDKVLTYEQIFTLLAQVEAVVNSRPLGEVFDCDVDYLSPAHFLLGRPMSMFAEPDLDTVNPTRMDYWQSVQSLYQGFWKRWHREYLTTLQSRPKWQKLQQNVSVGNLVLIMGINAPPAKWPMGRVVETLAGQDGLVRAVKIRTATGVIDRPITKIAVLPVV